MNIQNRQQLLGVLAIAIVALWAGDKLVLTPLWNSWKGRADKITKLRTDYQTGSRRLAWEASIQADWNRMRTNTLTGDLAAGETQMLKAFERWSRDSGVTISSVRPQRKPNAEEYSTIECTVDASGNLGTLTRFLYEIERDPLGLKVDLVRLNSRDGTGQQLELALQVSGLLLHPPRP